MKMEKFKITNEVKRDLSRAIKIMIKNECCSELAVMYDPVEETFFLTTTDKIEKYEYEGNIKYKIFTYYNQDKKITLKEIEQEIFS